MVMAMVALTTPGLSVVWVLAYCTVKLLLMLCTDAGVLNANVALVRAAPDLMGVPWGSNTLKPKPGSTPSDSAMSNGPELRSLVNLNEGVKVVAWVKALAKQVMVRLKVFCPLAVKEPTPPERSVGRMLARLTKVGLIAVLQVGAVDLGTLIPGKMDEVRKVDICDPSAKADSWGVNSSMLAEVVLVPSKRYSTSKVTV